MNKIVDCPYCFKKVELLQLIYPISQFTLKLKCESCGRQFIAELEYVAKKAECLDKAAHKWKDVPSHPGICRCDICHGMIEKKMIEVYFGK